MNKHDLERQLVVQILDDPYYRKLGVKAIDDLIVYEKFVLNRLSRKSTKRLESFTPEEVHNMAINFHGMFIRE